MLFKINSRCYFTYSQSKDEWSHHFLKVPANKEGVEKCTGNQCPAHGMLEANKTHPQARRSQLLRNCLHSTRVRNHSSCHSLPITAIKTMKARWIHFGQKWNWCCATCLLVVLSRTGQETSRLRFHLHAHGKLQFIWHTFSLCGITCRVKVPSISGQN